MWIAIVVIILIIIILATRKPKKPILEQIKEEHETKWYHNNATEVFMQLFKTRNEELIEKGVELFCSKFFESFNNIKALTAEGKRVDTFILGKELAQLVLKIAKESDGGEYDMQFYYAKQVFNSQNNVIINYAKRLNHNFYGITAFYIIHLLLLGYIDADKDAWIYDAKLFAIDPSTDEDGDKLYGKVSAILAEKKLLTQEILKEIEENLN